MYYAPGCPVGWRLFPALYAPLIAYAQASLWGEWSRSGRHLSAALYRPLVDQSAPLKHVQSAVFYRFRLRMREWPRDENPGNLTERPRLNQHCRRQICVPLRCTGVKRLPDSAGIRNQTRHQMPPECLYKPLQLSAFSLAAALNRHLARGMPELAETKTENRRLSRPLARRIVQRKTKIRWFCCGFSQQSHKNAQENLLIMLIAFTVQNFRSIRDLQTLSMEARKDDHLAWSNVIEDGKLRLVKSAAIYGPNASGKSNLIQAMVWSRNFVLRSSKEGQVGDNVDVVPFVLSSETENAPSHFETEFRLNGFDYRYGFEVTTKEVCSEWLYRKSPTAKEARLFTRERQDFQVSTANFNEGKGLEKRTRSNALFLSVCAQFNGEESGKVLGWMKRFRHVSGLENDEFFGFTADLLQDANHRSKLLELAQKADFNIQGLRSELEQITEDKLPAGMPPELKTRLLSENAMSAGIKTTHHKLDANQKIIGEVEFDLEEDESSGTQKFVALSGPIMHTLQEGSILLVDELEAQLHPRLTQAIVDLFHSPVNRKNAQLVCATHDVTLLDPERFRRDQIWFCEKDQTGATDLFTLADIDSNLVRPTSKFSRQYMLGLFGAVPQLAHFQEAAAHVNE